jgi:hypothetical protein
MYNIYIRDANFRRIGEITDYTKLDLIPRFNAVGTFAIDLPTDCTGSSRINQAEIRNHRQEGRSNDIQRNRHKSENGPLVFGRYNDIQRKG